MHQITAAFSVCSAALLTSRRSVLKSNTPSGRAAEPDRERQQLEDKERRLVDGWGGAKWCQRCLRCLGQAPEHSCAREVAGGKCRYCFEK